MTYKISGRFKESQIIREIKEGTFARNFVITIEDYYKPTEGMPIIFNIVGKMPRMTVLDEINVGDEVEIEFELRGRVSASDATKFFNNLNCRHITVL